ncbi:HPP family protein [Massilia sp. HP4]|uniref:HPP family protein n=1 Tax=Massilia sp. HP4 TaxID=2562316 RepID=UPI001E3803FD|nr:HPP family protein [Massilia sp. HP4]
MPPLLLSILRRPHPVALPPIGQARAAFGALFGLMLSGVLSQVVLAWSAPGAHVAWLVAPMAASAVLLFCVPASPLAQPWPVIGGNVVSALVGIACVQLLPDPLFAAPLAGGLSIAMMFLLRCLHPPGGAVAMTAVLGGPAVHEAGFAFALAPVGLNTVLLVLAALLYNRITGAHHVHKPAPSSAAEPSAVAAEDIDAALEHFGEALDVSRDDLAVIVNDAEHHAAERRARALHARDVVVPPLARLAPDMPLGTARAILLRHGLPSLPVVDDAGRLLGVLALKGLLGAAAELEARSLGVRALGVFGISGSRKEAERVADLMMTGIAVQAAQPATVAVGLSRRHGLARVPVVDASGMLLGMAGPVEVLDALHRAEMVA